MPRASLQLDGAVGLRLGQHRDEADALVEGALEVGLRHPAEVLDRAEDRRRGPRRRGRGGANVPVGSTRARLAARPPPVTWLRACTSTPSAADEVEQGLGVDAGRLEQLLAEGAAELVDVPVEGPAGARDDPAHEAVAVAVQAAAREGDHDVTVGDPLRAEHVGILDDAGGGAGDVVLVGLEQARGARRSRRRRGRRRPPRTRGDAADDRGDALGHDLAGGDVVGHEERLGAADDDVVDDHADEVEADGVVLVEGLGDGDLGADAVGARGEDGRVIRAMALASNMPAKPPRPPSTSGRVARRTDSFISSTALSPASTSTPAAAYVMGASLTPASLPAAAAARLSLGRGIRARMRSRDHLDPASVHTALGGLIDFVHSGTITPCAERGRASDRVDLMTRIRTAPSLAQAQRR